MSKAQAEEDLPWPAPRANPDLTGHEAAEALLLRASSSGRLPHAWLLTGPQGIGKATLAYRFARYLLAGGRADEDSGASLFGDARQLATSLAVDPQVPVARRIAASAHPDLFTLEPRRDEKTGRLRRDIVVEEVRQIGESLRRTPAEGGWRILVVDPADALNRSAANALLKLLEEPPAQSLILLISHAPGALLPTIRSRCCHMALAPLSPLDLTALLERFLPNLDGSATETLTLLSEGSIGRALQLQRQGGLDFFIELTQLVGGLPRSDVPALHDFAERVARRDEGQSFAVVMSLLLWWLAQGLRQAADPALAAAPDGFAALPQTLLKGGNLADLAELWEKLAALAKRVERVNLDRKQALIAAFAEIEALSHG